MTEFIDKAVSWLNQLYGLPAGLLVLCTCIVVGYGLKFWKAFPNQAIPLVVILFGGLMMSLIADSRTTSQPLRVWIVRNIGVGLILGTVAWIIHNKALSKLEDWIAKKFDLGDTAFFNKTDKPKDL